MNDSEPDSPELKVAVVDLVRGKLGCGCPDEVFEDIEVLESGVVFPGMPARTALIVGHRLLVLVMNPPESTTGLNARLAEFVAQAQTVVGARQLSRARLAFVTDDQRIGEELRKAFETVLLPENVFLHVLGEDEVPTNGL